MRFQTHHSQGKIEAAVPRESGLKGPLRRRQRNGLDPSQASVASAGPSPNVARNVRITPPPPPRPRLRTAGVSGRARGRNPSTRSRAIRETRQHVGKLAAQIPREPEHGRVDGGQSSPTSSAPRADHRRRASAYRTTPTRPAQVSWRPIGSRPPRRDRSHRRDASRARVRIGYPGG